METIKKLSSTAKKHSEIFVIELLLQTLRQAQFISARAHWDSYIVPGDIY
jgi:hypothetical protein